MSIPSPIRGELGAGHTLVTMDAAWTAYWTLKRHWLQNSTSELKTSSVSLLDLPQRTSAKPTHRQSGIAGTAKIDFTRPLDTSVVRGKTAIVFDAAKGLGNGIAAELARNGAYVAVCDPDEEAGSKAVSQLNDEGCLTKFFKTDTSSWESQGEAFRQILVWSGGQLDIVVTVPGIVTNNLMMSILPKHHLPGNTPTKPPTRVLEVDLIGVYYSATLALFYFNQIHADKPDMDFRPQLVFIGSMASVSSATASVTLLSTAVLILRSTMGWTSGLTTQRQSTVYGRSGEPHESLDPAWRNGSPICLLRPMSARITCTHDPKVS